MKKVSYKKLEEIVNRDCWKEIGEVGRVYEDWWYGSTRILTIVAANRIIIAKVVEWVNARYRTTAGNEFMFGILIRNV